MRFVLICLFALPLMMPSPARGQLFPYEQRQAETVRFGVEQAPFEPNGLDMYQLTGDSDHRLVQFASSFILYPQLDITQRYDDNVTLSETAPQTDWVTAISPSLEIRSNWERHALRAIVSMESQNYYDRSQDSHENYGGMLDAGIDFTPAMKARLYSGYKDHRLDRYNLFTANETELVHRKDWTYGAALIHQESDVPISASLTLEQTQKDFMPDSRSTQQHNDRTTTRVEPRISYNVSPDLAVYVQPSYQSTEFKESRSATGREKDAYIMEVMTGISVESKDLWYADISVGRQGVFFEEPSFEDTWVTSFRSRLIWTPLDILSFKGNAYREILISDRTVNEEITNTGIDLTASYALREAWLLKATAGYYDVDFQRSPREDTNLLLGGSTEYIFTPNLRAVLDYTHRTRDSNTAGYSMDNNVVMLNLRGSL